jgi:hypothetical protein
VGGGYRTESREMFSSTLVKIFEIFLRILQTFTSFFIVGVIAQLINHINGTNAIPPQTIIAVLGIACSSGLWSCTIFWFTCCSGLFLYIIEITVDAAFFGCYIVTTVFLDNAGVNSCAVFQKKYFPDGLPTGMINANDDCHLTKAAFGFSILNM